jgi:hypothetical protein
VLHTLCAITHQGISSINKKAEGSVLYTGQIEQVIEKDILPAAADNNGTNAFSKKRFGFDCAANIR